MYLRSASKLWQRAFKGGVRGGLLRLVRETLVFTQVSSKIILNIIKLTLINYINY